MFTKLLIPFAVMFMGGFREHAYADPIVVLTWEGTANRQCFDTTECRGYGNWNQIHVTVDGVPATPPSYLLVTKRPNSPRPGCSLFTTPGLWTIDVGTVEFNNFNYASGLPYIQTNLCSRGGGTWYGAENTPDENIYAWLAPDGSSGTIVVGASLADSNYDGERTVQDLFLFLDRYWVGDSRADLDGSAAVTIDDVWGFVGEFLS